MERLFRINSALKFLILFLCTSMSAVAQVPAFDKLEQLYDQGRYQLVYRKSVRLSTSQLKRPLLSVHQCIDKQSLPDPIIVLSI